MDEDTCIGCSDCGERCPVETISFDDDTAVVDSYICIENFPASPPPLVTADHA